MEPHQLTQQDARRIALRAQLLTAERPTDLLDMVRHLTLLPTEPTAPIATSYDLLCWSRLGSAYDPEELTRRSRTSGSCTTSASYRPVEDLPLHRAEAPYWPGRGTSNRGCTRWPGGSRRTRSAARTSWPRCAPRGRCRPRAAGHLPAHVGLDGLDQQQERPADALVHAPARRGRGRLEHRSREAVGPGRAGVRRRAAARPGRGVGGARRPSAPGPGHRPPHRSPPTARNRRTCERPASPP